MYKYCLFDLDGTLTDPKEGICKSVSHALKHFGIDEPDLDKLEPFIGPPLLDSFRDFYNFNDEDATKAIALYRERFGEVGLYENLLYDGIADLLAKLRQKEIKLAIASSKPTVYIHRILKHFKIHKYFDVIMGSELDGTRSKKDEVIEAALLELYRLENPAIHGLDECTSQISDSVMIGDRHFDIVGAKRFGLDSIGVSYGYGSKKELQTAGATFIADSVDQLRALLIKEPDKTATSTSTGNSGISKDPSVHTLRYAVFTIVPIVLYYLIDSIIISGGLRILNRIYGFDAIKPMLLIYYTSLHCLALAICGILLFCLYRRTQYIPRTIQPKLLVTPICGTCLALGVNLLFGYANTVVHFSDELTSRASYNTDIPILLAIIWYVLMAPIVEELLFRWVIYGRIKAMLGSFIAVILSAAFFGVYHGNLLQGTYAFIMGIFLALCVEWTNSIYASIIFHIFANFTVYFVAYLPDDIKTLISKLNSCVIMLVIAAILMKYLHKTRKVR